MKLTKQMVLGGGKKGHGFFFNDGKIMALGYFGIKIMACGDLGFV